jgi:hypothetical protein
LIAAILFLSSDVCPEAEAWKHAATNTMLRMEDTYFRFFIEASFGLVEVLLSRVNKA